MSPEASAGSPGVWIFSTEPDVYPFSEVFAKKRARWDGIRGPLARKYMRSFEPGDLVLGYHSSPEKALVCVAKILNRAYPDPADDKWLAVDVGPVGWLEKSVSLAAMRAHPGLAGLPFLRIPRLSVSPVTPAERQIFSELSATAIVKK